VCYGTTRGWYSSRISKRNLDLQILVRFGWFQKVSSGREYRVEEASLVDESLGGIP
jgi:hypothetical protein